MPNSPRHSLFFIAFIVVAVSVSLPVFGGSPAEMPSAPSVPNGWAVTSDVTFPPSEVDRIAQNLGAKLEALRNTDYLVNSKRVRINTLLAPTEADAKAVKAAMEKIKPAEFSLRIGRVVYEFVGKDAAIPEMRAAAAHIRATQDDVS